MITCDTEKQIVQVTNSKNIIYNIEYKYEILDGKGIKLTKTFFQICDNGYTTATLKQSLKNTKQEVKTFLNLLYFSK